ncbi:MAG: small multi-drug export protein [Lachnospiraceae bacterium]|nr:small multi-drug export protein [Lachnospiraceae bacterium]
MVNDLVNFFTDTLGDKLPKEWVIFIISMLPILELRGGIIAAAVLKVPIVKAIIICTIGNIIPIPFILWLITDIFDWLKKTKFLKPKIEKLEKKALSKSDKIQKYEFLGLVLFVGIPLPGTGAWTGSLIAALLGIRPKKSIPAILLGICLALLIMCTVSYFIPWLITSFT